MDYLSALGKRYYDSSSGSDNAVSDSESDKENIDPKYVKDLARPSDKSRRGPHIATWQLYLKDVNYYCVKEDGHLVADQESSETEVQDWSVEEDEGDLNIISNTSAVVKCLLALSRKYHIESRSTRPQLSGRGVVVIQCVKYVVGEWQIDIKGDAAMLPQVARELVDSQMELASKVQLLGSVRAYMKLSSVRMRRIEPGIMGFVFPIYPTDHSSLQKIVSDICNLKAGKPLSKCTPRSPFVTAARRKQRPLRVLTQMSDWDSEVTQVLSYQQREVSCIIGRQGHRLNAIRESSGCTIKVLPVDSSDSVTLSLPRKSVPQSILLTGTRPQINLAVAAINHCILQYRESDIKFI